MNNPFESIESRLSNIESLILDIKHQPEQSENTDRWFDLNELVQYDPQKRTKATWYSKVSKGEVPYHKNHNGKKLYFLKSEIDAWLKEGRKKTHAEIEANVDASLSTRKGLK